jgi:hypothetical protein
MSCVPDELFAAAKAVGGIAKDEAMYRAVANRAYYASYHCCRLYHAALPHMGVLSGKGVHEQLIAQLQTPSQKLTLNGRARSSAIGKYLRQICLTRAKADYNLDDPFDVSEMDFSMTTAASIFAGSKITKGPPTP